MRHAGRPSRRWLGAGVRRSAAALAHAAIGESTVAGDRLVRTQMPSNTGIDPELAYRTGVAHRLALSFATLVVDQALLSESDVPFEPFTAPFGIDQRLTASSFREALGFESTRTVDMSSASKFLSRWRRTHATAAIGGQSKCSPCSSW